MIDDEVHDKILESRMEDIEFNKLYDEFVAKNFPNLKKSTIFIESTPSKEGFFHSMFQGPTIASQYHDDPKFEGRIMFNFDNVKLKEIKGISYLNYFELIGSTPPGLFTPGEFHWRLRRQRI